MKKQFVHVVTASTSHESSSVIAAFTREEDAKALATRCHAYESTRPQGPREIEDTPENDALHEAWYRKLKRWQRRHPAGDGNDGCDYYTAEKIPLDPGKPATERKP